jgi:hypothetical protein
MMLIIKLGIGMLAFILFTLHIRLLRRRVAESERRFRNPLGEDAENELDLHINLGGQPDFASALGVPTSGAQFQQLTPFWLELSGGAPGPFPQQNANAYNNQANNQAQTHMQQGLLAGSGYQSQMQVAPHRPPMLDRFEIQVREGFGGNRSLHIFLWYGNLGLPAQEVRYMLPPNEALVVSLPTQVGQALNPQVTTRIVGS